MQPISKIYACYISNVRKMKTAEYFKLALEPHIIYTLDLKKSMCPRFKSNVSFILIVPVIPIYKGKGKGKAVPLQAWSGPEGSRK
jgi:hypothetical protein